MYKRVYNHTSHHLVIFMIFVPKTFRSKCGQVAFSIQKLNTNFHIIFFQSENKQNDFHSLQCILINGNSPLKNKNNFELNTKLTMN